MSRFRSCSKTSPLLAADPFLHMEHLLHCTSYVAVVSYLRQRSFLGRQLCQHRGCEMDNSWLSQGSMT